jgi:hypothetical protein
MTDLEKCESVNENRKCCGTHCPNSRCVCNCHRTTDRKAGLVPKVRRAAQEIVREWDHIEALGGETGQVEQDGAAVFDTMVREVEKIILAHLR